MSVSCEECGLAKRDARDTNVGKAVMSQSIIVTCVAYSTGPAAAAAEPTVSSTFSTQRSTVHCTCDLSFSYTLVFGRPFVKRFALCYRTIVCPVCLVCDVGVWSNGSTDQNETWRAGRPRPRPHCVKWRPSSPKQAAQPPTFRPMSIVAIRSPISATAKLLCYI